MVHHRLPAVPIRPRITRTPHHIRGRPIHVVARGWVERPLLAGWVERPREAHRRASAPAAAARQSVQQLPQLLPFRRVNDIIGIEPERIVAGGPRQRRVAGCGEVVDPDEIKHPRPELTGDLPRAVLRSRINDHDLIEQARHGRKAFGNVILFKGIRKMPLMFHFPNPI